MDVIGKGGDFEFIKLASAGEIDRYEVPEGKEASALGSGFSYFKGMGIVNYVSTFKAWLRKFPRPIFIIAVHKRKVVGWVYIEEWSDSANSGESVYVLRAIEIIPNYRRRKVASLLLVLGIKLTPGYMITKPLNSGAEAFYRMNGFKKPDEFPNSPVDLIAHHGYMILPPYNKQAVMDRFIGHFLHV